MKFTISVKPFLVAAAFALLVSGCATTDEELTQDGPPPLEDQTMQQDGFPLDDDSSSGVDTSGISDDDQGIGTAIVEDAPPLGARELLEQADGPLSNRTIYFEFDSAKLTEESIAILETHGNFVASNGTVEVRLEGHADERGSREYNIALGDRRAQSVRRVLLFQGASSDQIETVSYGEEQPAVEGHNEQAWAMNRRVELIYTVK